MAGAPRPWLWGQQGGGGLGEGWVGQRSQRPVAWPSRLSSGRGLSRPPLHSGPLLLSPETRNATITTPRSFCTTSTPPRGRAFSTAGPMSWATCSRYGVGSAAPGPLPPSVPGRGVRTQQDEALLCAHLCGAPGCRSLAASSSLPRARCSSSHHSGGETRLLSAEASPLARKGQGQDPCGHLHRQVPTLHQPPSGPARSWGCGVSQPYARAVCTPRLLSPGGSLLTGTCLPPDA